MASPQFSIRILKDLNERLVGDTKQNRMTKDKVAIDTLAYCWRCSNDVLNNFELTHILHLIKTISINQEQ